MEAGHEVQLTCNVREIKLHILGVGSGKYLHILLESVLSHFPCLFVHVFISRWTLGYLFCSWVKNSIQCYLFCCSNCFSFAYWQLFHLTPMSFPRVLILFIFKALSYFPALQNSPVHLVLFPSQPRISCFSRELWFFFVESGI